MLSAVGILALAASAHAEPGRQWLQSFDQPPGSGWFNLANEAMRKITAVEVQLFASPDSIKPAIAVDNLSVTEIF